MDFLSTEPGMAVIVIAQIRAVLQMMEPIALPYAMEPIPFRAEVVETMTSGRVVPMETTVAPISISGRWNFLAMPVAPSTNQSPPKIRQTRPIMNNTIALNKILTSNISEKNQNTLTLIPATVLVNWNSQH